MMIKSVNNKSYLLDPSTLYLWCYDFTSPTLHKTQTAYFNVSYRNSIRIFSSDFFPFSTSFFKRVLFFVLPTHFLKYIRQFN